MTVVTADEDSGVDMSQIKADNGKKKFNNKANLSLALFIT